MGGLFSDFPCKLKIGASRENFSSKWVHPEKSFLQNGCIQRKLSFKMGSSRKKILQNLHSQTLLLQNSCIKITFTTKWVHQVHFFLQNLKKRIILSFKVSRHVTKELKVKSELCSKRRRSVKRSLSCFFGGKRWSLESTSWREKEAGGKGDETF